MQTEWTYLVLPYTMFNVDALATRSAEDTASHQASPNKAMRA